MTATVERRRRTSTRKAGGRNRSPLSPVLEGEGSGVRGIGVSSPEKTPSPLTPLPLSPGAEGDRKRYRATGGWRDDPDVQLMHRVKGGDDEAFALLQERYAPRVFGYFCKQFRDRGEAEDLTQDVFLRLYRSRLRYEPRAKFATWIFHITHNVARNAIRSRRRRPCVHLDPEAPESRGLFEAILIDQEATPSRPLERDELAGQVRAAVAELATRQRTAVELHQFHDRTYAEVARDLSMTPKAAKSLLYRARNQLREMLAPVVG